MSSIQNYRLVANIVDDGLTDSDVSNLVNDLSSKLSKRLSITQKSINII